MWPVFWLDAIHLRGMIGLQGKAFESLHVALSRYCHFIDQAGRAVGNPQKQHHDVHASKGHRRSFPKKKLPSPLQRSVSIKLVNNGDVRPFRAICSLVTKAWTRSMDLAYPYSAVFL